jgi:hypothetical protein
MNLSETINQVRHQYIASGKAKTFYEINNGLCDDFAADVIALMGGYTKNLTELCNENFMIGLNGDECGDDVWDWKLLKRHWGITPPAGLTKSVVNNIGFGGHVWIFSGQMHYDAECPDGVASFFDLPLFRRYIVCELRERGIPADEVVTDDVIPPPLCPIQNKVDALAMA